MMVAINNRGVGLGRVAEQTSLVTSLDARAVPRRTLLMLNRTSSCAVMSWIRVPPRATFRTCMPKQIPKTWQASLFYLSEHEHIGFIFDVVNIAQRLMGS